MVQDHKVCDPMLPFDTHMKVIQRFDAPSIKASDLTYIKKASDDNYLVYLKFGGLLDIVSIQYTSSQSVQGLTRIADPGVDFFVDTEMTLPIYLNSSTVKERPVQSIPNAYSIIYVSSRRKKG